MNENLLLNLSLIECKINIRLQYYYVVFNILNKFKILYGKMVLFLFLYLFFEEDLIFVGFVG